MVRTNAQKTMDIREYETEHAKVSRKIATEGIVLLKNNGVLPIKNKANIALYGEGAVCTLKGGTGSGEVNSRYNVSIWQGLRNAGFNITTDLWLNDYLNLYLSSKQNYLNKMRKKAGLINFPVIIELIRQRFQNPTGMKITDEYLSEADYCIYVLSRQAGEHMDRLPEKGDFLMTDDEVENIKKCTEHYKHTIVVINVGGFIDLSPLDEMNIDSIVFFCQQGAEGGNAFADIISGKVTPSAHLASTWMKNYGQVPFGEKYSVIDNNVEYEDYSEGIYVGYRYYDSFNVEPRYPFGYGLSYTTFGIDASAYAEGTNIKVKAKVGNIGDYNGKEVVQVYCSCPQGNLDKEYQRLVGFAKTKELKPNECDEVEINFDITELTSYDEQQNAFILEKGKYIIRVGNNSRNTKIVGVIELDEDAIVSKHDKVCEPQKELMELKNENKIQDDISGFEPIRISASNIKTKTFEYKVPELELSPKAKEYISKLKDKDFSYFCSGTGNESEKPKHYDFMVPGACGYTTGKFEKRGIPAIPLADGPAGLRLYEQSVVYRNTIRMAKPFMEYYECFPTVVRKTMIKKSTNSKTLYQYATAFPVGIAIAQTWNRDLAKSFGRALLEEMEIFGVQILLAPGMNIHRNPLCGRNYEYYSEDPYLSGNIAASVVSGVQEKEGYGATIKHFCCNNQEINRTQITANISIRALREIYIRNFGYAIKENPKAIMASYNRVNGTFSSENYDLITKVLRNEFEYKGLIMTDWTMRGNMLYSGNVLNAGVNIMMPGIPSDQRQIKKAVKNGELTLETIKRNASYVIQTIANTALANEEDEKN